MGKKNIAKKKKKKGQKKNQQINQQGSHQKRKNSTFGFPDTKSFVAWVIAMIIAYGLGIWCLVLAFDFKKDAKYDMYGIFLVVGSIIVLVLTAFLLAAISGELAAILIGVVLVLMGLVLPIVSEKYIIILLTALIWISGILIIIDNIAKLTHTTDRHYYKVIFGATGKVVDFLFGWMTGRNPKARKYEQAVAAASDVISNFKRTVVKACEVIMLLALVAYACVNLYLGDIPTAVLSALCALFVLFILIRF